MAVRRIFAAETPEYFVLLGTTLFLVIFGLVMVLSSSSVESFSNTDDFFARFARQALFASIGVPIMLMLARLQPSFYRRWAWAAVIAGVVLQLLVFVPGLGTEQGYNNNWIRIGGLTFQPSEFVKLALVIWLAVVLSRKKDLLHDWKHVALPIGPVALVSIGLVMLGKDLGTVMILVGIVFGALFFAGVKLRFMIIPAVVFGLFAVLMVKANDSRSGRFEAWLNGCSNPADYELNCWQTIHGWWALAGGGLFGRGLGNSTAKWSWLPAADNDFIFAVIGEELGLVGAILLLLVFVGLAICFVRVMRMQTEMFPRVAVGAAMVWIIGQALVNIAVVLGVLPVLGVPLPFVSSGGSALVTNLAAVGVALSFARVRPSRVEPGLVDARDSLQ
ncbi:putative lipid II flippase FtsW [Schumannella sp. 10F1B-5-1]|uniref:putative lipid II flippase FtsW n=1 Tax=Schumannella sp. 10F1B-5-1 TaxID=2590780 RepID=UPI00210399E4|nr:putative lipid II flippase FtsW [Schumannella sp. 10F1B-5-1]